MMLMMLMISMMLMMLLIMMMDANDDNDDRASPPIGAVRVDPLGQSLLHYQVVPLQACREEQSVPLENIFLSGIYRENI